MAINRNSLSGGSGGGTYTYNVGNQKFTQSQLNNNMSGNDANAIYYATHGGSGYATPESGNVTVTQGSSSSSGSKGSGSGSKSSSGSTSTSLDASSLIGGGGGYDANAAYMSMIQEMLAKQQAAAEAAYEKSMSNLNAAYDNTYAALERNLNSTLGRLDEQYKFNEGRAQNDANKSLREAYINYMMNKKNLNQGLSALGMSGGATESSMAKLFNNYGNSRNNINTTLADNLAMLLNELSNNKSQAEQLYDQQDAEARLNYAAQANALNSALMNAQISNYSGSNLSNLASYAAALNSLNNTYEPTPTVNSLAVNQVSTKQGNDMGSVTDYAKWKAMADNIAKQGGDQEAIIYQLLQNGASKDAIRSIYGY